MEIDNAIIEKAKGWLAEEFDNQTREAVADLIANNPKELEDAFYQNLSFGTGGLRGVMGVGSNRMNRYTVGMATQGLANYLKRVYQNEEIRFAIAYDNRNNSQFFAETVASVAAANGFKVYLFNELRPTPELSFAIRHFNCHSGVMVTASHNPREYNGYKAYWNDGAQVVAPHDTNIIEEVNKITSIDKVLWSGGSGEIISIGEEIDTLYLKEVKSVSLSPEAIAEHNDIKIVYTPIHGTGVRLVPMSLRNYGFTNISLVEQQAVIDGDFPTVEHPNPEDPNTLSLALKQAREEDAELLLATDPDADRIAVGVKDDKGDIFLLNGNQTCVLLTYYLLRRWKELGKLTGNEYIIKTIVTTTLMGDVADSYGVKYYNVLTGFKYIASIIRENEDKSVYIGGGEESFGYLIGSFVRDKDAVTACPIFAEMMAWCKSRGTSIYGMLMDIYKEYGFHYDALRNVVRKGISGAAEIKAMMENYRSNPPKEIAGVQVIEIADYLLKQRRCVATNSVCDIDMEASNVLQYTLSDGTLISVRPSGTEPKIKFYYGVKLPIDNTSSYSTLENEAKIKIEAIEKSLGLV